MDVTPLTLRKSQHLSSSTDAFDIDETKLLCCTEIRVCTV